MPRVLINGVISTISIPSSYYQAVSSTRHAERQTVAGDNRAVVSDVRLVGWTQSVVRSG